MNAALTYEELKALSPCRESFERVTKLLGGKSGWNGNKIDAAKAREAGCTFDDIAWAASATSRKDKDVERRLLLWIADCLAHIADVISSPEVRSVFDRCVIAQRKVARGDASAEGEWKEAAWAAWDARDAWDAWAAWAARAAWAAWDARAAWGAWGAWDARGAWAARAAWDARAARAARDAEASWQFDRLISRLSDDEPEDWPLPAALSVEAA
jgi:hypothetical protein